MHAESATSSVAAGRTLRVHPGSWWTVFVALALVSIARADTIVLKDGRRIEGTVVSDAGGVVKVQTRLGDLEFPRADVASIEKSKTRSQEFADKEAAAKSAEDFYQLGLWAEQKKLKAETKKSMARALELDPNHALAHGWFGHVQYKGEWMTPADRDARMAKELEAEMLAKGLVRWQDRWVTPDEKAHLEKGEILVEGKWLTFPESQRKKGLEEFNGAWLPRAEALARIDVAAVEKVISATLPIAMTDDAIVAGPFPAETLEQICAGLKKGRAWFDRVYKSPHSLDLCGGRLAELYIFGESEPYLSTIPHFNALTKTLPEGWAEAVTKTHGYFFADPYPLSSARLWQRAEDDLIGHCYHHWGHLLLERLGYDGRLLPPWYEEGLAGLLEYRSHERNAVFCRGRARIGGEERPAGPSTGGGRPRAPGTKAGSSPAPPPKVGADFDPKDLGEGRWKEALKAGIEAKTAPPFDHLATLQFTELESADIAASMGIVEWLESRGPDALRAFHDELRKAAPLAPSRVIENSWQRDACYQKAFMAAVKMGWKEADQAWRQWLLSR